MQAFPDFEFEIKPKIIKPNDGDISTEKFIFSGGSLQDNGDFTAEFPQMALT